MMSGTSRESGGIDVLRERIWTREASQLPRYASAFLATVLAGALVACGGGDTASRSPDASQPSAARQLFGELPASIGYSQASRFGDLVLTAGHLPEGIPPTSPIENQVEQALDNLEVTLEDAGAGFDTVLQTRVYLTDFADWPSFNRIYVERFGEFGLPPRTTVVVSELGLGYDIEIEVVAHIRPTGE